MLTPIMELSSLMVTCLARSTAVTTCCWCCTINWLDKNTNQITDSISQTKEFMHYLSCSQFYFGIDAKQWYFERLVRRREAAWAGPHLLVEEGEELGDDRIQTLRDLHLTRETHYTPWPNGL